MPRGQKECPNCHEKCGPRSFVCPKCGTGFTIKGEQHHDIQNIEKKSDEELHLAKYVKDCQDEHEKKICLKYFGENALTMESHCGLYRIRYCPEFEGIKLGKMYKLMHITDDGWRVIHNFTSLDCAIKFMIKHKKQTHSKA